MDMENIKQVVFDVNKEGFVESICVHYYDETMPLIIQLPLQLDLTGAGIYLASRSFTNFLEVEAINQRCRFREKSKKPHAG